MLNGLVQLGRPFHFKFWDLGISLRSASYIAFGPVPLNMKINKNACFLSFTQQTFIGYHEGSINPNVMECLRTLL